MRAKLSCLIGLLLSYGWSYALNTKDQSVQEIDFTVLEESVMDSPVCTIDYPGVRDFFLRSGITLDPEGFEDTKKPNAVVVYPCNDTAQNGRTTNQAFYFQGDFLERISNSYDVRFVLASFEEDLYSALRETSDIALVVVGGHGGETSLRFSLPRYLAPQDVEQTTFDPTDEEFSEYLGNLLPNVRWVHFSCSNGEGGLGTTNLATMVEHYIREVAPEAVCFFGSDSFTQRDIHISPAYPLMLQITRDGEDITVTNANECLP